MQALRARVAAPITTVLVVMFMTTGAMAQDRPGSFADQVDELSPAVVNISTTTIINDRPQRNLPQFPPGSPFEDFFRGPGGDSKPRRTTSLGSGFIVDAKGIVVTNFHVIENAEEITVTLADETSFTATVLGQDRKTDIAVLKIDPAGTDLNAVSFGDSDELRVGDWVMAIGNPFGLGGTVTAGIVSARGRDIGNGPYDDFIQTDASINSGNSGGPLFNLDGEVIGINTAIFSQSGGSVGIGFAISSNLATRVVDQLSEFGTTRRGWLGVFIQEVTPDIAEALGLGESMGALVSSVNDKSPADTAGVEPGDVIISFDGKHIERLRDLPRIVAETDIGAEVNVELHRNGKRLTVRVTLGELEQAELAGLVNGGGSQDQGNPRDLDGLGLVVDDLTEKVARDLGLDPSVTGVVITKVTQGGPAFNKGVAEGDIIRRFGQRPVTNAADLIRSVDEARAAERSGVLLYIERDGSVFFRHIGFADQ